MSHGIDISNNNSSVDWNGVTFVFIKATEGTTFIDRTFNKWQNEATALSIPWSAYHFAHPDQHSATDEAHYFLSHATKGPMPPALDFESRKGVDPLSLLGPVACAAWIDEFCQVVQEAWGQTPYIYMNRSYAVALFPRVGAWGIWLAAAKGSPTYKTYAGRTVDIEQWGIVDGIDRNESYTVPAPPSEEDNMKPAFLFVLPTTHVIAVPQNGARPWHIPNQDTVAALQFSGVLEYGEGIPRPIGAGSVADGLLEAASKTDCGGAAGTAVEGSFTGSIK